jgi:hypothetical protein
LVYIVGNIIVHSVDELKPFELEVIELKQGEPDVPGRAGPEGGQAGPQPMASTFWGLHFFKPILILID